VDVDGHVLVPDLIPEGEPGDRALSSLRVVHLGPYTYLRLFSYPHSQHAVLYVEGTNTAVYHGFVVDFLDDVVN
jgi:hypothetical protein